MEKHSSVLTSNTFRKLKGLHTALLHALFSLALKDIIILKQYSYAPVFVNIFILTMKTIVLSNFDPLLLCFKRDELNYHWTVFLFYFCIYANLDVVCILLFTHSHCILAYTFNRTIKLIHIRIYILLVICNFIFQMLHIFFFFLRQEFSQQVEGDR